MRKFVTILSILFYATICFAQKNSPLRFDFTSYVGITPTGTVPNSFNPYMSYDIGAKNIMLGIGFEAYEGEHYSDKSVHVSSYTRQQNGKTVHVKSYNRSKPGLGGGSNTHLRIRELFAGYYLHCASIGKSRFYVSPVIGITDAYIPEEEAWGWLLWGASLKIVFNGFGFGIKGTSNCFALGLSYSIF